MNDVVVNRGTTCINWSTRDPAQNDRFAYGRADGVIV